MKLIEAGKVKQVIKDYWKAQVDKALTFTFTDVNEANKRINSYLEHNHELLKAIDELPPAEPYTTTHDSIPAETGKNNGDRTSGDCISRQQAIDEIHEDAEWLAAQGSDWQTERMERDKSILMSLPSAQPEQRWIPVTEKLPKDYEDVLVWFEYFRYGDYNRLYQTHGIGDYSSKFDSWMINHETGWNKLRVIAWMPLPEPYQEGGIE